MSLSQDTMGHIESKHTREYICGKFKIGHICQDAGNCQHTVTYGTTEEVMSKAVIIKLLKCSGLQIPEHFTGKEKPDVGVCVQDMPIEPHPVRSVQFRPEVVIDKFSNDVNIIVA